MKSEGKIGNFIHELREKSLLRYNIVKGILLILLVIFIAGLLSANAGSDKSVEEIARMVVPDLMQEQQEGNLSSDTETSPQQSGEQENTSDEDAGDSQEEGVFDGMGQATVLDFKRIFGLNAEDYEGIAYFKPVSQMDVEELLIVKVKSEEQMESLEEAADERIENQKKSFDGYGAAQCVLLEKAIVKKKGNFLFYCTSPDAEEYCNRFVDAM